MRTVVVAIEAEYLRYKRMGESVLAQLDEDTVCARPAPESNSVAMIVWHVSGNLESRFTDFLTTDGEKPWRDREGEFAAREATPGEVAEKWARGWRVLLDALAAVDDADLSKSITIRGVELSVLEALQRSLAHTSYHVGQMAYLGKLFKGSEWSYLTIPPGGSAAYDADPKYERGYGDAT